MVSVAASGQSDGGLGVVGPGSALLPASPSVSVASCGSLCVRRDASVCATKDLVWHASLSTSLSDCISESSLPPVSLSSCTREGVPKHVENKSQRLACRLAATSGLSNQTRSWMIRSPIVMYPLVQVMCAMDLFLGLGFLASPMRSPAYGVGLPCGGGKFRLPILTSFVCGVSPRTPALSSPARSLVPLRIVMPTGQALSLSS